MLRVYASTVDGMVFCDVYLVETAGNVLTRVGLLEVSPEQLLQVQAAMPGVEFLSRETAAR